MLESIQQYKSQEKKYPSLYYAPRKYKQSEKSLKSETGIVSIKEIQKFYQLVAQASVGKFFLIHVDGCAKPFYEFNSDIIYEKLDLIQRIAEFFQIKTGLEVIRVGQLAEPLICNNANSPSIPHSEKNCSYYSEMLAPSYNKYTAQKHWRMLVSYNRESSVFCEINKWNRKMGNQQNIFTSHEAIELYYEKALTQLDSSSGNYYNLASHFPRLGKNSFNSIQHLAYMKKIANPIALKIGPDVCIPTLIRTLDTLDPEHIIGRITLIPELGVHHVYRILPQLINAIKKTSRVVLWSCDPMQGNTEISNSGKMIIRLSKIVEEIEQSFLIHKQLDSQLNAIHLGVTHQNVTECLDYGSSICDLDNYKNGCKNLIAPRLNFAQTMHVMRRLALSKLNNNGVKMKSLFNEKRS